MSARPVSVLVRDIQQALNLRTKGGPSHPSRSWLPEEYRLPALAALDELTAHANEALVRIEVLEAMDMTLTAKVWEDSALSYKARAEAVEARVADLVLAVEALLGWAERYRGGDPKLDPEEWYIVSEHAARVVARAALAATETSEPLTGGLINTPTTRIMGVDAPEEQRLALARARTNFAIHPPLTFAYRKNTSPSGPPPPGAGETSEETEA